MRIALPGLVLLHVALFVWFYPDFYLTEDAKRYIETAHRMITSGGDFASWKPNVPLGNAILLIPFVSLGFESLFLMNTIFHVLSTFVFILILKETDLSPLYAVLFLFQPSLVLFIRPLINFP